MISVLELFLGILSVLAPEQTEARAITIVEKKSPAQWAIGL